MKITDNLYLFYAKSFDFVQETITPQGTHSETITGNIDLRCVVGPSDENSPNTSERGKMVYEVFFKSTQLKINYASIAAIEATKLDSVVSILICLFSVIALGPLFYYLYIDDADRKSDYLDLLNPWIIMTSLSILIALSYVPGSYLYFLYHDINYFNQAEWRVNASIAFAFVALILYVCSFVGNWALLHMINKQKYNQYYFKKLCLFHIYISIQIFVLLGFAALLLLVLLDWNTLFRYKLFNVVIYIYSILQIYNNFLDKWRHRMDMLVYHLFNFLVCVFLAVISHQISTRFSRSYHPDNTPKDINLLLSLLFSCLTCVFSYFQLCNRTYFFIPFSVIKKYYKKKEMELKKKQLLEKKGSDSNDYEELNSKSSEDDEIKNGNSRKEYVN